MKLTAVSDPPQTSDSVIETVYLTTEQYEFLRRVARNVNPDMPVAFGAAHVVRTLLERFEQAGVTLPGSPGQGQIPPAASEGTARRPRLVRG